MLAPTLNNRAIKFHLGSSHDYKFHAFTIQVHLLHSTSKAYPLFSTVHGRSKEYLSIPGATQENLELNPPPHPLHSHLKQKDEILDWPNTSYPPTIEALQPTKITKLDLLSLPWMVSNKMLTYILHSQGTILDLRGKFCCANHWTIYLQSL